MCRSQSGNEISNGNEINGCNGNEISNGKEISQDEITWMYTVQGSG